MGLGRLRGGQIWEEEPQPCEAAAVAVGRHVVEKARFLTMGSGRSSDKQSSLSQQCLLCVPVLFLTFLTETPIQCFLESAHHTLEILWGSLLVLALNSFT